jgi:hypothetical protein
MPVVGSLSLETTTAGLLALGVLMLRRRARR